MKIATDILDTPLSEIINDSLSKNSFPEEAKVANVFKKDCRTQKANYRPVSILIVFSKIFELWVNDKMEPYINETLSILISAYRKHYSSSHVLLRLIEEVEITSVRFMDINLVKSVINGINLVKIDLLGENGKNWVMLWSK